MVEALSCIEGGHMLCLDLDSVAYWQKSNVFAFGCFFMHFRFSERFGIQKLAACWESSHEFTCRLELLARELSFPP